jgi:hypothetical protein
MKLSIDENVTSKYRFTFRPNGSLIPSERHFSARDSTVAKKMFQFACQKEEIRIGDVELSVWNRWSEKWEFVPEGMDTV